MDRFERHEALRKRHPVVAGQFYPGQEPALARQVATLLGDAGPRESALTVLAMVPHAGYVYSGAVAGRTLGRARLADRIVLLGPNHPGRGRRLAVWPDGAWAIPGRLVPVDEALAGALLAADNRLTADMDAHLEEHSLEGVLPFLAATNPACRGGPVAVSENDPAVLAEVAEAMAKVLAAEKTPVSIVVSSDMSHYIPHEAAKARDSLALERVLALDPQGLYQVVRQQDITMCGVLPMVLGLTVAKALGATQAVLAAYATSGEVSGDYHQVVGYAGVLVRQSA